MKHWNALDWSDYVKGVVTASERRRMQAHLSAGCSPCRDIVAQLERIVADAAVEMQPPDHAVAGAIAVFGVHERPQRSRFRWVPLEVAFDSWAQPAQAGTRALCSSHRHLVFNSREFTLDARMVYADRREEMSVVGQIVTRGGTPLEKVPTFLKAGGRILSQAHTSEMGEFQMVCREANELRLCLALADQRLIEVDLDRRRKESAAEPSREWDFRGDRPPD